MSKSINKKSGPVPICRLKNRGMTLIEVLVSIFILTVLFSLLTTSTIALMDLWRDSSDSARLETRMNDVLTQISADLRSLSPDHQIRNLGSDSNYRGVPVRLEELNVVCKELLPDLLERDGYKTETFSLSFSLQEVEGEDLGFVRQRFRASGGVGGCPSSS